MKAFRDLTITGTPEEMKRFVDKLLPSVGDDWERDATSEARLAASLSGATYCFVCSERDERPRAALWLHHDTPAHAAVANVFPILKGRLTRAEYNAIVAEFHRRFVKPAAKDSGTRATLTEENTAIEAWVSPHTAALLRRFSRQANRSTGTTHPLDEHRWFEFVWASHKEGARLSAEILALWLEEDEGWPEDEASKVAQEYEKERALLAFPSSPGPIRGKRTTGAPADEASRSMTA